MNIHSTPDQLGGVWANAAAVRHSPHEFTIDFLRCDFDENGQALNALLVQRVNMSPLFVTQLISALQDNWSKYASKALPHELMADPPELPDLPGPSDPMDPPEAPDAMS
jgi:Protein of unknown function (DUF3467)